MEIGIISDTHDHMANIRKILSMLKERQINTILHAGDFVSPFTWRAFKNFDGEIFGVFGNNDGDRVLLKKMYGHRIEKGIRSLEIGGRKIALMHEPQLLEELALSKKFHVIVYGHMHEIDIRRIEDSLILNPGEACGWLYGKPSFIILNLETLKEEIIYL